MRPFAVYSLWLLCHRTRPGKECASGGGASGLATQRSVRAGIEAGSLAGDEGRSPAMRYKASRPALTADNDQISLALESAGDAPYFPVTAAAQTERVGPTREACADRLRRALEGRSSRACEIADEALAVWPVDPELLLLAALAALAADQSARALALLKRYGKRYKPGK